MRTHSGRGTIDTPNAGADDQISTTSMLTQQAFTAIPKLVVSNRLRKIERYDPSKQYEFRYRAKGHRNLPHMVKFSGGRSSGMLLFALLENKILDPARGDVIVFNNTSSEHPDTYRFARDCQEASSRYGVPFFWIEFQTYEDARNGEWTRIPSYRLVNEQPKSPNNPDGFHWRGEVFEELLSWSGYVPNQFSRICTQNMKLEATRLFLKDWLACKEAIPRLGHHASRLAQIPGHSSARSRPRFVAASNTLPTSTGHREGTNARSSMRESRNRPVASEASSGKTHAMATEQSRTNAISICAPPRRSGAPRARRDCESPGTP